jgi:hypothetical protein
VTAYTVTITAEDSGATAQLRLDTTGEQAILTDIHLHHGNALPAGQLPAIDYTLLLQAIDISRPARAPATKTPAGTAAAATTQYQPASGSTNPQAARPRTRGAAARTGDAAGNTATTAGKNTKKTAINTGHTGSDTTRRYRHAPDDLAAVYQKLGSAAAVADHYQVPRHTANGWIRRLRDQASSRQTTQRVGLFSHPPQAELFEQRQPPPNDGIDWQATPFSDRAAEHHHAGQPGATPQTTTATLQPARCNDNSTASLSPGFSRASRSPAPGSRPSPVVCPAAVLDRSISGRPAAGASAAAWPG